MNESIIELDVHSMTKIQARAAIDAKLRRAPSSVYRLRVIHGYNGGTALRDMVRKEYAGNPKVRRVEFGMNQGATDLVLREF
ncbi:MAG: Smr/MutS family protein [Candidatus Limivicinus sp.]